MTDIRDIVADYALRDLIQRIDETRVLHEKADGDTAILVDNTLRATADYLEALREAR
jgi:hypothetical protein